MVSTWMFVAEITLTLGVALGFGFWQLWDLKREKAKDAAKAAVKQTETTASSAS
jgi:hypothetical protein